MDCFKSVNYAEVESNGRADEQSENGDKHNKAVVPDSFFEYTFK